MICFVYFVCHGGMEDKCDSGARSEVTLWSCFQVPTKVGPGTDLHKVINPDLYTVGLIWTRRMDLELWVLFLPLLLLLLPAPHPSFPHLAPPPPLKYRVKIIRVCRLKSQKTVCSSLLRIFVRLEYSSDGLVSHCFYGAGDKPAIISLQNSSLGSAQKTYVLTSASRPQRNHVLAEVSSHV